MDRVVVDNNVFKHVSPTVAIAQCCPRVTICYAPAWLCGAACCASFSEEITKPIDVRPNNVYGVDPLTELGECDFAGGGKGTDKFMATGVTWWAKSPDAGPEKPGEWRYLNTMQERLAQLELGDFDHDGICDVRDRLSRKYSKSGTGPWVPLIGGIEPRQ